MPTCKEGQLEARTTKDAEKVCGKAIIGKGTTDVEVEFAESKPVQLHSKLLIFNGGKQGQQDDAPDPRLPEQPGHRVDRHDGRGPEAQNGRYGLKSVATIPKIANYAGSVTDFNLVINKKGYLLAKCPTGHIDAKGKAVFKDGTEAEGEVTRPCTPVKG